MKIKGNRTFLELRVGSNHSVEVILYLRQADIDWYNSNSEEHTEELYGLMTDSVIPRMCGDEIEHYYSRHYPRDFPAEIGEKNITAKRNNKKGGKRKRGVKNKQTKAVGQNQEETSAEESKKIKDIYYAFGENLHVAYRAEDLDRDHSATLIFRNNDYSKEKKDKIGNGPFKALIKLSKRIVLWCYPLDPNDPTEIDPEGGGFRRPELIPIANLFRAPPEEDEQEKPAKKRR